MELFEQDKREEAAAMQLNSVNMVRCLVKYPPIPAQRAIMKMEGFELGNCRLPLVPLSKTDEEKFKSSLEEIDFFNIVNRVAIL